MSFNDPIIGGSGELVRNQIRSPNYDPGIAGWIIRRDGTAEFQNIILIVGYAQLDGVVTADITQALTDAAQALLDAAGAQATADSKIETYYQATPPVGGSVGDLWFDTDDGNKPYRHDGANWIAVQDADAAQALIDAAQAIVDAAGAQATADGKVTIYYDATAPPVADEGDLWYDTDDGNKKYRRTGGNWVALQTGTGDIADDAVNSAKITDLASSNFVTGVAGWAIFQNGDAEFWNVAVRGSGDFSSVNAQAMSTDTLELDGEDLSTKLVRLVAGEMVHFSKMTTSESTHTTTGVNNKQIFWRFSFVAKAGRAYQIRTQNWIQEHASGGLEAFFTLAPAAAPTTASTTLGDHRGGFQFANQCVAWWYQNDTQADQTVQVGVAVRNYTGVATWVTRNAGACYLYVQDMGPALPNQATITTTAGTINPGTYQLVTLDPTETKAYSGANALLNTDGLIYQGEHASHAGDGNCYTDIFFDTSASGLGDLTGITADQLLKAQLKIYWEQMFPSSNPFAIRYVNARYGYITKTTHVRNPNLIQQTHWVENSWYTIDLRANATINAALRAGTIEGITVGPGANTNPENGAVASGRLDPDHPPELILEYYD